MVYQNTSKTDATTGSNIADRLQALPEFELGLTNILNILLIAVGVVLILFSYRNFHQIKNKILETQKEFLFFAIFPNF